MKKASRDSNLVSHDANGGDRPVDYDPQHVLRQLLQLSLENIPIERIFEQTLDLLFAVSWLAVEAKGSIFLVENDDPETLVMKVQKGLPAALRGQCQLVAFGTCICGKAAAEMKTRFVAHVDDDHEITHEGMEPHGHYAVPIISNERVLGLLNLYLRHGHEPTESEEIFLGAVADTLAGIIARKQMESEILNSSLRFESIVNTVDGIVWEADADGGQFRFVSRHAERILGYPVSDWLEQPEFWSTHIHPDDREWVMAYCQAETKAKRAHRFEYRMTAADGRTVWLDDFVTVIIDGDKPPAICGVMVDITEKKLTELALHTAHDQLESRVEQRTIELNQANRDLERAFRARDDLLRTSMDGFWIIDLEGNILEVNESYCRLVGFDRHELLSMNAADLNPDQSLSEVKRRLQELATTGERRFELRHRHKTGRLVDLEVSSNYTDHDGGRIFAFFRDIGERKQVQAEKERLVRVLDRKVKELKCLYALSSMAEGPDASLDQIMQELVDLIPSAWQYPAVTTVRIRFGEREFATTGFSTSRWCISSNIDVLGTTEGTLEVYYQEQMPEADEGPFLQDEKNLLDLVAHQLGRIVEQVRVEETLRLRSGALQAAANAVLITDRRGTIRWTNPAFTRLTGYSAEEAVGQNPRMLKSGEHDPQIYRDLWETVLSGQVWQSDMTNRRKDGTLYVEEMTITPFRERGGDDISHFIAIKEDISKRTLAEGRLKLSNRFQVIGNQHIELDGLLREYAAEIRQFTGCAAVGIKVETKHQRLRYLVADGYDSEFLERRNSCPSHSSEHICAQVFQGVSRSGSVPSTPYGSYYSNSLAQLTEGDGICDLCINHGFASMAAIPIRGPDRVVGLIHVADQRENMLSAELVSTLENIAGQMAVAMQRVMAEQTLRESKEELQAIYDGMVDGVLIIDTETKELLVANQAVCGMFGFSAKELLEMTMKELHPSVELEWVEDRFQDVLNGKLNVMKNLPCRRKDGSVFYADVGASAIRYDDRSCLVGFYRDITERKQTEEALQFMAAEIAHEIRNPLSAITTGIDLLVRGDGRIDSKLHEGLQEESRRLEDILTNFLSYARRYVPNRTLADPNLVLEEIASVLRADERFAGSTITTQLDEDIGKIPVDRDGIRQVVWNLALNGLQSMPDGGLLNLHSQYCDGCVQIEIEDGGCGMTTSQMKHIFEPFFTTKSEGTGLGLAIAQKIVKGHGGTIEVKSTVGEGTVFQVRLPTDERIGK